MSSFEERENSFETEFAHNAELKFKVESRRDKIVGAWAAEKLGKSGEEADDYAKALIRADLKEPGDADVFAKLREDLPKGDFSDEDIREAMNKALAQAMKEVREG